MTPQPSPRPRSGTAWDEYLAAEHAARNAYLAAVEQAHTAYMHDIEPFAAIYRRAERSAWVVYNAAGRRAWEHYTAAQTAEQLTGPAAPRPPIDHPGGPGAYHRDPGSHPYLIPIPTTGKGFRWPRR